MRKSAEAPARRKIIVHIATSADGYIARLDDDMEWLTSRPAPKGFYGMPEFERSIDTKILGRKTYDWSRRLGAAFGGKTEHFVFSQQAPPKKLPSGVHFVNDPIAVFAERLRQMEGKNIWLMGGGGIIASFLDANAIDEFVVSIVPVFIGEGIPLLAPRHRHIPLSLRSVKPFPDGVVQVHYEVIKNPERAGSRARG